MRYLLEMLLPSVLLLVALCISLFLEFLEEQCEFYTFLISMMKYLNTKSSRLTKHYPFYWQFFYGLIYVRQISLITVISIMVLKSQINLQSSGG
jgi:hypothetical protein